MPKKIQTIISGLLIGVLTYFALRYAIPAKVIEREVVKIDTEAVRIAVEAERAKWAKATKEKIVIVKSTDGTERTEIERSTDESSETESETVAIEHDKETVEKVVEKIVEGARPQWSVGLAVDPTSVGNWQDARFSLGVDRNILGGVWVTGAVQGSAKDWKSPEFFVGMRIQF